MLSALGWLCRTGSQGAVKKVGAAMGMILGKITVETPKYQSLEKKEDIEIREYEPAVVAEVTYDPKTMKNGRDGGFMILAGYIGAVGTACNKKGSEPGEKIAMTAPVITQEHGQLPFTFLLNFCETMKLLRYYCIIKYKPWYPQSLI